jgi:hypothetical protein
MNDVDKILRAIEGLTQKVDQQGKAITAIQGDVSGLKKDVSGLKDGLAHTTTAMKAVAAVAAKKDVEALPTKKDVEEIVETAVDVAKSELRADILRLDAKIVRKIPSLERRVTNIEEQEGIENPEKH